MVQIEGIDWYHSKECYRIHELFANRKFQQSPFSWPSQQCILPSWTPEHNLCQCGKKVQRNTTQEGMTWTSKIHASFFPVLGKLVKLYFLVQRLSIPQFCLELEYLSNLDFYLVGFSDSSDDFSTACVYIISANKKSNKSKVQLVTTVSKIQSYNVSEHVNTIPQNETYSAYQCSYIMLKVA